MANPTCPACSAHLSVSGVNDAALFRCPYCPKRTQLVLYKCFSCMGISAFVPTRVPRACPRCRTLVRTLPRHVLAPPPSTAPFVESHWLYHVTSVLVARSVKVNGLLSAYLRTGSKRPDPKGSFARDFVQRAPQKIVTKLKEYLGIMLACGASVQTLNSANVPYVAFAFVPTSSNDDYVVLTQHESQALKAFAQATNINPFNPKHGNRFKRTREPATADLAQSLATHNPQHYLVQLATQYVNEDFGIEGAITACHVYFLNSKSPSDMRSGFSDYIKLRETWSIAVLRVRRERVIGLMQDEADFRALRTMSAVHAREFEIMVGTLNPVDFLRPDFRQRHENWMPLSGWNG